MHAVSPLARLPRSQALWRLLVVVAVLAAACAPSAAPSPTQVGSPNAETPAAKASAPTPSTAPTISPTSPAARRLNVATSVAPITNIARNVGGSKINLRGLVPGGVDSHTYEPTPQDAQVLAEADLIVLNGLNLEVGIEKLAEATKKPEAVVLKLGDNTVTRSEWVFDFSFPEEQGNPNPHLWMSVPYARRYAELVRDALVRLDAANAEYYRQNTERYVALLDRLDAAIEAAVKTIPEEQRKLVTYHDSFAYFARRYGMTVIAAIQPSDFSEPSAKDMADIVNQLRQERVPAIFASEVFPSKVVDQIGREAGVRFVETLRDDDLPGEENAPEHTYVGMMVENVRTMVEALGGNPSALDAIDPRNTYVEG